MTIECSTMDEFTAVLAGLVREGCTFKACASRLLIECTGGY